MRYLLIVIFFLIMPAVCCAAGLADRLSGEILLNVEGNGEAWYVYPEDNYRYYLGRPADAFRIMRELGLGIREIDFQRIAAAGMPVDGDLGLAGRLSGRIILQVEKNGEAWYIYPRDLKKYYLGRPVDAFRIMRELSLGINREDLAHIHKPGFKESIDAYSSYEHKIIGVGSGKFTIDVATIDLANPDLRIITDTALALDCESDCPAKPLGSYVLANNAFAGINGSYFCTSSDCEENYYFFPIYNSREKVTINYNQLKYWTTGPIMAFDTNNKFYYFKDSRDFPAPGWSDSGGKSVDEIFKSVYGATLQAAIGNKPRLIEDGLDLLIEWDIDEKQRTVKSNRNAIGYKDNKIYLVIARNSTVPDLANIMKTLGVEYALNLDGGYSSALWYNDEYMVGPGRDIPNAILFSTK